MNDNDQIHDEDAEKESAEYAQQVADQFIPVEFVPEVQAQPEPEKKEVPIVGSREALKNLFSTLLPKTNTGTANHNPSKKHGNTQPKKYAQKIEKKARLQSKKSRKINRGK